MKLPIGISTFSEIITGGYYYVDKTPHVAKLAHEGKYYFLSRPRRFGKSLFLDTLSEAFKGNRELFKGLFLEKNWDWETKYPIIFLSFGGGVVEGTESLNQKIQFILTTNAEKYGISIRFENNRDQFNDLIITLHRQFGQKVAILIDEYDKPILDNIANPEKALEIREGLKNLYSVIKDCDAHVKFCFITGVSKFSKVSLFSGLNNLEDITLRPPYSSICGYTQKELENVFSRLLAGADMDKIKKWYDGYRFNGDAVYNPFDVLLYFRNDDFGNYWFETATPAFLIKLLESRRYYLPNLECLEVGEQILGSFDVDQIHLETLLFQTGYLTIKSAAQMGPRKVYTLGFPNLEVQLSLTDYLLDHYINDVPAKSAAQTTIYRAMDSGEIESVRSAFSSLFAAIPHDWYRKNRLDRYEGYYASIFYACFSSLGFDLIAEDTTNHGRIDLTVFTGERIYIFEFKVIESTTDKTAAFDQLSARDYHRKYMSEEKPVYLVGIDFSREKRNITAFKWKKA